DRDERKIDIHHIFPRKWCEDHGRLPRVFNSIINKTAISYKANRMIGGKAPSAYLQQIQRNPQVQLDDAAMDSILRSHLIEPAEMRLDDFDAFYRARKAALLNLVSVAMGKAVAQMAEPVPEDVEDEEEEDSVADLAAEAV